MKILFLSLIVMLVGCGDSQVAGNNMESNENAKQNSYLEELDLTLDKIASATATAEKTIHMYSFMWNSAIESNSNLKIDNLANLLDIENIEVRKYFKLARSGSSDTLKDDFNLILIGLENYYSDTGVVEELETDLEFIQTKLRELNSPPSEYENIYDVVLELYTLSSEYIQLAISPTGSMRSFNEKTNDLSAEIINKFNRIDIIFPEE